MGKVVKISGSLEDADHVSLKKFLDRVEELAHEHEIMSYVISAEHQYDRADGTCFHGDGFMCITKADPAEADEEAHQTAARLAESIDIALTKIVHAPMVPRKQETP